MKCWPSSLGPKFKKFLCVFEVYLSKKIIKKNISIFMHVRYLIYYFSIPINHSQKTGGDIGEDLRVCIV